MIVSISGASGTGKTTAIESLKNLSPRYKRLKSYTTRRNRSDDPPGEICSISECEFDEFASSGEFLWHTNVYGNKYGALRSEVRASLADTETVLLCDVAPEILPKLEEFNEIEGSSQHALRKIYLAAPPMEELGLRLRNREMSPVEVEKRLRELEAWDQIQLTSGNYDAIISAQLPPSLIVAVLRAISLGDTN